MVGSDAGMVHRWWLNALIIGGRDSSRHHATCRLLPSEDATPRSWNNSLVPGWGRCEILPVIICCPYRLLRFAFFLRAQTPRFQIAFLDFSI